MAIKLDVAFSLFQDFDVAILIYDLKILHLVRFNAFLNN